ncbi:chaplin [Streptomyces sp. 142MFCol3.1]|uniref:chaplin n=1 Tax=Streptomyces sp. 142MFCol3.1 TaxID=1172179 RepID=UPI0004910AD8|nr:chaplin [Streptomyces sp. 142MFCol3.1]
MNTAKKVALILAAAGMAMGGAVGSAVADAGAEGLATNSPGVLSGNVIQVPVHVPVNACGNSISVIGLLNPAFANACAND